MSFTESNTVEQMILDAATSLRSGRSARSERGPAVGLGRFVGRGVQAFALDLCGCDANSPSAEEVMVEPWLREALIGLEPGNRGAARPGGRSDLCPAGHPARGGRGWFGAGEREFHRLAARGEDHALRPERRACAGAAAGFCPTRTRTG